MKRTLLTAVSLLCCVLFSQAQLRIAILGGGHQSNIIEENDLSNWNDLKDKFKGRGGAHFGFLADLPFSEKSNFSFQPGVIFYNKGRKFSTVQDSTVLFKRPSLPDSIVNTTYSNSRKQFLNYIDIPLNFVYKIRLGKTVKFILGGGPYVSFFYNGFDRTEHTLADVNYRKEEDNDLPVGKGRGKYSTLDYGVNGLAGFEIGRVFLTANYSRGLKDFYEPTDYTATDYKHEVKGVTLGIFLGKAVRMEPKDKDGDGIPDRSDACPDLPGTAQFNGCPDTDKDGVPDNEDGCPGQAGPVENKGCPYTDKDGDGVLDKDDTCPTVAGEKDNRGCPYEDRDKDGVPDKDDKCPDVKGLSRYHGCPIPDTDGDGVNDEEDKCPSIKGTKERQGCPEPVKQEIVKKVELAAKRIQFKVNSATLTATSYKVLDGVADLLNKNAELRLTIGGHTSSEGSHEVNRQLSADRANAVKDYLATKGVDVTRLRAIGYGPDKPLNEGRTEPERALNRRVEMELSNQ